jgi:AmmeMemoRadiSam system protein A/AmmeMemoRadiSam system protein B
MVPEVGGAAIVEVRDSINGMQLLAERLVATAAETLILISPHAPLEADSFVAYASSSIGADFRNFRAPETGFDVETDLELLDVIVAEAAAHNYSVHPLRERVVDHGTAVPLYFLLKYGWSGRVVALGYSFLSNEDHIAFGESIRRAIEKTGKRVAFVASGDLSHRLKPEAPAGYNPQAHSFDDQVVEALRDNSPQKIVQIDHGLRRLAGECGYRSMLVAIGTIKESVPECEVISYEAPFGVGYMVAQLTYNPLEETDLPSLARRAVETFVREGRVSQPMRCTSTFLRRPAPCFVSLKTTDGDLRGCIGTIEPCKESLAEEIVANAVNAAMKDPRFEPVEEFELDNLRYSVDVLLPAEATTFADLDPKIYGVIVEDEEGERRGLLLPDITGVDSARQQVDIAARKAGIPTGTPVKLFRFKVERFRETQKDK